jgi:hypothetical protein
MLFSVVFLPRLQHSPMLKPTGSAKSHDVNCNGLPQALTSALTSVLVSFTSGFTYGVSNGASAWGVMRAKWRRSPVVQSAVAECTVTRF